MKRCSLVALSALVGTLALTGCIPWDTTASDPPPGLPPHLRDHTTGPGGANAPRARTLNPGVGGLPTTPGKLPEPSPAGALPDSGAAAPARSGH